MGLCVSHGPVCAVVSSGHVLDGLPQVLLEDEDHQTSSLSRDILELVKHDARIPSMYYQLFIIRMYIYA